MAAPTEDPRLDQLVELVVALASGDLGARLEPSPARDSVDAVITGVNLLAAELEHMYSALEQRVAERTAQLHQAHLDLQRLALHDPLTGLANRALLQDRIARAAASAQRTGALLAVLLIDLDEFKSINDSLGHSAGDAVLVEVAARLVRVVRDADTVARLGGDEFAILLPEVTEQQAMAIARRAREALQQPVEIGDRVVWAMASIGVRFAERQDTSEVLLRDADVAMYAAKARGRDTVQVFEPAMRASALARRQVAAELSAGVEAGQLRLLYQPLVELGGGAIIGAEALVRWQHPERGLLSPAEFIPVAEETGLISEVGRWVLRTAVGQLAAWDRTRALPDAFTLHVNVSAVEIRRPGLTEYVRQLLRRAELNPGQLAVEITETGLMTGDADGLRTLRRLHALGVSIEIDDFGTGYSSISYLRHLPVDAVKTDRSLITDIPADPQQRRFVAAILQLIDSVGLRAVIEGVDTAAHVAELRALGCSFGQGFFFSPPVPAKAMTDLLFSQAASGGTGPAGKLPSPRQRRPAPRSGAAAAVIRPVAQLSAPPPPGPAG